MQVWFKNRKVGEAHVPSPHPGAREIRMATLNERSLLRPATKPGEMLPEPVVHQIVLPLDVRRFVVDQLTIYQEGPGVVGMIMADNGVQPHECEVFTDHNRDAKVYQFKIIRANLQLLEEIFDMDWFEPADGERDPEYFASRAIGVTSMSLAPGSISSTALAMNAVTSNKISMLGGFGV